MLTHPANIDLASLLTGLGALAILVLLARTRLAMVSALVALVIPTVVVILAGLDSVARVGDAGDIPRGIPVPQLPDFGHFSFSLVTGALAVAAIVLVQGAGVAEAAPNSDGTPSDINRDIIAQGAANLASGFFRGVAVGGSVGQTALNVRSGARTRWAPIFAGLWMLVILVAFSGLVAKVALPDAGRDSHLRRGRLAAVRRGGHHPADRDHLPDRGRSPPSPPRSSCRSPRRWASVWRSRCCCS